MTARAEHTATLLKDGKVLVVGGVGRGFVSAAELYDPDKGTWTFAGSPRVRRKHTATLLADGRVLVSGGVGDGSAGEGGCGVSTAELYDPNKGTWTDTGKLAAARYDHTAILLADGNVLVSGGTSVAFQSHPTTDELYDPKKGTWSATGVLNTWRESGHTATLLPNGKVLVSGGNQYNRPVNSAELYDPTTRKWTNTESLRTARDGHTATLLLNGKVLVSGGYGDYPYYSNDSAELYDPDKGTWSSTKSLVTARGSHTATLLSDGTVLVSGGSNYTATTSTVLGSVELYDQVKGNWTTTTKPLATARIQHTATLLHNGKILICGGYTNNYSSPDGCELY